MRGGSRGFRAPRITPDRHGLQAYLQAAATVFEVDVGITVAKLFGIGEEERRYLV
jgi:hypothetical protein